MTAATSTNIENLSPRHSQSTLLNGRHIAYRTEQLLYRDFIFIEL